MITHAPPKVLVDELDDSGVRYDVVSHRPTQTAREEARALHVSPSRVAKTVVLVTPHAIVRAVLPASKRVDLHKIRHLLQTNEVGWLRKRSWQASTPISNSGRFHRLHSPAAIG